MAKPYGRLYQKGKNVSIMGIDTYDVWPIGSVYISVNSTNPSTYFGGTWIKIAQGRTLVGEGTIVANNDNWCGTVNAGSFVAYAGNMGGEVTHKITTSEMPSHTHYFLTNVGGHHRHEIAYYSAGAGAASNNDFIGNSGMGWSTNYRLNEWLTYAGNNKSAHQHDGTTNSTGGGGNHNNLMPYLVVYIWKRTA
jgi:microcystin-dependent protein